MVFVWITDGGPRVLKVEKLRSFGMVAGQVPRHPSHELGVLITWDWFMWGFFYLSVSKQKPEKKHTASTSSEKSRRSRNSSGERPRRTASSSSNSSKPLKSSPPEVVSMFTMAHGEHNGGVCMVDHSVPSLVLYRIGFELNCKLDLD